MNQALTPAEAKPNFRENFGKWAGNFYIPANVAMTFKGPIDSLIKENKFDMTTIVSDPLSMTIGGVFLGAGLLLSWKGDSNKWAGISLAAATVGYGFAAAKTVFDGYSFGSTMGVVLAGLACGYSTYQAYRREKKAQKEQLRLPQPEYDVTTQVTHKAAIENKKPEKKKAILAFFKKAGKTLTEKYPFWALGAVDIVGNAAVGIGALGIKDYVMFGVAALWTIGSALLATALPKVNSKPQPA